MKNKNRIGFGIMLAGVLLVNAAPCFALDAIGDLSGDSVIQKIGNVIKFIGVVVGIGAGAWCAIKAALANAAGQEGVSNWVIRAALSVGFGLGAWALANLLVKLIG